MLVPDMIPKTRSASEFVFDEVEVFDIFMAPEDRIWRTGKNKAGARKSESCASVVTENKPIAG